MRLIVVMAFSSTLAIAASDNVRSYSDVQIKTPAGVIRALNLSARKGARTRLTGALVNDTGKTWDNLTILIQPTDGAGTAFRPFPLYLFGLRAGESKPFYFDVTGKFDFATLAYALTYREGSYSASYGFEMLEPVSSGRLMFSDDLTEWKFLFEETAIGFEVTNKSGKVAKLDWNQAAYIDSNGRAHKVAGSGTRYIEISSAKPPTTIPPGARVQDAFIPTDYVSYADGWTVRPFLPKCPECKELAGTEFRIFVPIEIAGSERDYTFRFRITVME